MQKWMRGVASGLLLVLAACTQATLPAPRQENPEAAVFTDSDIDRATVAIAKTVGLLEGDTVDSSAPGLELPPLPDVQSEVTAQLVLPNTDGFVYSISNDPNAANPWRIVRHNQVTDERVNVLVTKREIQSVAGSSDGNIVMVSMRQTTNATSDFEIFRLQVSAETTQNLTADAVDNIHVGVSADGLKVVWQHPVGTQETVFLRTYASTTTSSFTEVALGGTPLNQVQPSLSGNGRFIALIRDGLRNTVRRFDTLTNSYVEIDSAFAVPSLSHPSVSDDGNKVAWLFTQQSVSAVRVKNLLDNSVQDVLSGSNGDFEHPFITFDGDFLSYALKQDNTFKVHVKNLITGVVRRTVNPTAPISHTGSMWQKIPLFSQESKVPFAPTSANDDQVGSAIAVEGNTLVSCAFGEENGRGACHVFTRSTGVWTFVKRLQSTDIADLDFFGAVVAISGNIIVVGVPTEDHNADGVAGNEDTVGAAYVFERNRGGANNWGQARKLIASDDAAFDGFGNAVAIKGDLIVVGVPDKRINSNNGQGSAYIFSRNQGGTNKWGQIKQLVQSDPAANDKFGTAVAVDGVTVVIGARRKDAAYIFEKDAGGTDAWGQVKKLSGFGSFGSSAALEGDTLAIGARQDAVSGSVSVFGRNQGGTGAWGLFKKVFPSHPTGTDFFGEEIALKGDTLVVSSVLEGVDLNKDSVIDCSGLFGSECDVGAAYIFQRNIGGSNIWGELRRLVASDAGPEDQFGSDVAIGDGFIAIGSPGPRNSNVVPVRPGLVYSYE